MATTKIKSTNIETGGIGHSNLVNSGATAGTYGAAASIPVLTVTEKGIITAVSTVAVAGVSNFTYNSGDETLTISTADGNTYEADISGLASETYVDTAESDAVSTANTYTDGRETAITTAYQAYADQAELDAVSTANAYTDQEVAALVDSSPGTLDTLNELAAALGDDPNFASTVSANIGTRALKTTTVSAGTGLTGGGDLSANRTINLANTSVVAGSYGSSSQVPVITVDAQGRITSASSTAVAGVSSTAYNTLTGVLTINTSDGGSFTEDLGVGTSDSPQFTQLTLSGTDALTINNTTARIRAATNLELIIDYDNNNLGSLLVKNGGGTAVTTIDESGNLNTAGNITVSGTVDGRDIATDGTKLDGIESGATADQTASEILTLLKTVDGSGSDLNADLVDGLHASQFLRSDTSDQMGGNLTVDAIALVNGASSVSRGIFSDGTNGEVTTASQQSVTSLIDTDGNGSGEFAVKKGATDPTNASTLLVVKNSGNVGIGTADPNSKLEVASSANVNNYSDGAIQVVSSSPLAFVAPSNLNPSLNRWGFTLREGGEGHFGIRDYRQANTRVTIDDNGNVGIGTTSPGEKLHVEGSIRASGNIGVTQTDGDYLAKLYQSSADGFLELFTGEATPVSRTKLSSYGNSYINPNGGNVGIGDTTPSYKLDVNGTIRATGDVIADSDVRLKSDIQTLTNAVDTVKALRGTAYIKDNKASIGVIAQEVEEVIPQLVSTADDEMGTKSVSYGNMVAVLIEAIKEQQEQIDELKKLLEAK